MLSTATPLHQSTNLFVLPGQADALEDIGEPETSEARGAHTLMKITDDYWALVGPDAPTPPDMKDLIEARIDLELFEVTWDMYTDTLVTSFLRIL